MQESIDGLRTLFTQVLEKVNAVNQENAFLRNIVVQNTSGMVTPATLTSSLNPGSSSQINQAGSNGQNMNSQGNTQPQFSHMNGAFNLNSISNQLNSQNIQSNGQTNGVMLPFPSHNYQQNSQIHAQNVSQLQPSHNPNPTYQR